MSITPRFGFVLDYVTDVEVARQFYVDILGLKVERYHPTFIQFGTFAIASDESMTGTRDTELYWLVDDAEAAFRELSPKAEVILPVKQMPFGKVFSIKGPDNRPRHLLELARDRPSRAV